MSTLNVHPESYGLAVAQLRAVYVDELTRASTRLGEQRQERADAQERLQRQQQRREEERRQEEEEERREEGRQQQEDEV